MCSFDILTTRLEDGFNPNFFDGVCAFLKAMKADVPFIRDIIFVIDVVSRAVREERIKS